MYRATFRQAIRRAIGDAAADLIKDCLQSVDKVVTEAVFQSAGTEPSYLDYVSLRRLQSEYPFPPPYGYDPQATERRGTERASQLLSMPGGKKAQSFLEIGCWDAMVSCALRRTGKQTTAIDASDKGFDSRAADAGVTFARMNAEVMAFADQSFDFVYSYNAFEHFAAPDVVFSEAIRVLKPGGCLYLDFGPLYFAPLGQHAYRSITVPYCQFLFAPEVINSFARDYRLAVIDFSHVNGWSLPQYRTLWANHARTLERLNYVEVQDLRYLHLIRRYPSCFKSKSTNLENFLVTTIRAFFKKRIRSEACSVEAP